MWFQSNRAGQVCLSFFNGKGSIQTKLLFMEPQLNVEHFKIKVSKIGLNFAVQTADIWRVGFFHSISLDISTLTS